MQTADAGASRRFRQVLDPKRRVFCGAARAIQFKISCVTKQSIDRPVVEVHVLFVAVYLRTYCNAVVLFLKRYFSTIHTYDYIVQL